MPDETRPQASEHAPSLEAETPGLHPLERALLTVSCVHLSLLPWALGAMHVWSQVPSFLLGLASLILAIQPRNYPSSGGRGKAYRVRPLQNLFLAPLFWCGACFLAYIVIQGLNPSLEYAPTRKGFWLRGISHLEWLPSGLRTPFEDSSPWRSLLVYGSAWLSACAVWVGFTRRKSLRILLSVLAVNALALAVLGLLQRASKTKAIFWTWQPPSDYFVSSFIYRNHAGAYFGLLLAVACALAVFYFGRRNRDRQAAAIAFCFAVIAAVQVEIILSSNSRGALLLMGCFFVFLAFFVAKGLVQSGLPTAGSLLAATGGTLALAALCTGFLWLRAGAPLAERMATLKSELLGGEVSTRRLLDEAGIEMAQDAPVAGWGAGSYRYIFPAYQQRHPEIVLAKDSGKRLLFEHAHNDYLEAFCEFGVLGCLPLAALFIWQTVRLLRAKIWNNPSVSLLLAGCLLTGVHASFDFPFANSAVLVTWCCLWPVMMRLLEMDNARMTNVKNATGPGVSHSQSPRPGAAATPHRRPLSPRLSEYPGSALVTLASDRPRSRSS